MLFPRAGLLAAASLAILLACLPALAGETIEPDPEAEAAFFRGIGLMEAGDPAGAAAEFETAVTIQPEFRRAYYYRASALLEMGDLAGARQSADAYSRFDLGETEREQLEALRERIGQAEAAAAGPPREEPQEPLPQEPVPQEPVPQEPVPQEPAPQEPVPQEAARSWLARGEAALKLGDCAAAMDAAQSALRLDPAMTAALRLKGLGLLCAGELDRARAILLTWKELHADAAPDAEVELAIEKIDAEISRRVAAAAAQVEEEPGPRPPGADPLIKGVLDDEFGSAPTGRRPRVREVAGIGRAEVKEGRIDLAGSRGHATTTRVYADRGLDFSRVRVWGRSGSDRAAWFAMAFFDLYVSIVARSGEPATQQGLPDPARPTDGATAALSGLRRWEATWEDGDGDSLLLRLGRCDLPGQYHPVVAENGRCLELSGARGGWSPVPEAARAPEAAAVRLAETPGALGWDLAIFLGGGAAPGFTILEEGDALGNGEFGADLLALFGVSNLSAGVGWAASLGVSGAEIGDALPSFDSRMSFYLGVRDKPRQPQWAAVLLGLGLVPDQDMLGRATVAPAISLRVLEQVRVSPLGRFFVSFEPYVVAGVGATRVVPLRFTIGGGAGTRQRLAGGRQPDPPRW